MCKWFFVFIFVVSFRGYGQSIHYAHPQKLPLTINTRFEDTMPMLSPGGDTLYFTRIRNTQPDDSSTSGHDIWYSIRENGEWSEAKNDLLNLDQFNGVVGVGGQGQTLYLLKYQNHTGTAPTSSAGIAYARKYGDEWQEPQKLNFRDVFTNNTFFGFFMSSNEQLLLISMRGLNSMGKEDLYVSFQDEDNQWTLPKHLGPVINSRGYEISPFLSKDGKTLYFSSNGHGGLGNADIFVSERLDDSWGNWSIPRNMGKPINSAAFDAYFIQGKENEVFFASNRNTSLADIYHAEIISSDETEGKNEDVVAKDGSESTGETKNSNSNSSSDTTQMMLAGAIYFNFNSEELTERAQYILREIAHRLKAEEDVFIELVGYTDNVGSQRYNLKLSRKRAKAARDFLIAQGLNKDQISMEGRGILDASVINNDEDLRRLQRKVDITYTRKP